MGSRRIASFFQCRIRKVLLLCCATGVMPVSIQRVAFTHGHHLRSAVKLPGRRFGTETRCRVVENRIKASEIIMFLLLVRVMFNFSPSRLPDVAAMVCAWLGHL